VKLLIALLGLLTIPAAQAHEGHDHGAAPAPVVGSVAPRFEARTDLFELVGVLAGEDFVIYLDRADSNAPVEVAELEIESGAFKVKAQRADGGSYRIKAGPLAAAGRHALTVTVQAGDDADLLTATFDNASAKAMPGTPPAAAVAWPWLAGGAVLLAAGLAGMLRRRRK
jgi:hypothetical protein